MWFAQVEAQFATKHITAEATKYSYVVAALTPDIAQEVRDILLAPPADNPYKTLREELIKRTSATEQKRLQQLLNEEVLGDRKPTQFLRHMRKLLGDRVLDDTPALPATITVECPNGSGIYGGQDETRTVGRAGRQIYGCCVPPTTCCQQYDTTDILTVDSCVYPIYSTSSAK